MCSRQLGEHHSEVQKQAKDATYQSPPESARAEFALLPAAAEAKEGGAIVLLWWLCAEVAVGLSRPEDLVWGGGRRVVDAGAVEMMSGLQQIRARSEI
jgi:hypothetical protein